METTVPAFKSALKSVLEAALPGALVTVGHPYPVPQAEAMVIIGAAEGRTLSYVHGMMAADERYRVPVTVSVVAASAVPYEALSEQAYAIADACRDAIAAWAQAGTGVVGDCWVIGSEESELMAEGVRECAIELAVEAVARV